MENIAGIVAEYNPFHNGHLWHMEQAKGENTRRVIVAMSGPFTQRGESAIICKRQRAKMALLAGASLVIEIPVRYACAGAESFARGSVSLLNTLGIVTPLCFGTEDSGDGHLAALESIAGIIADESPLYKSTLREHLNQGLSFPRARLEAVFELQNPKFEKDKLTKILKGPNNILALEYLSAIKRLKADIKPIPVKRKGAGHDSSLPEGSISSASYIRSLLRKEDASKDLIKNYMPDQAYGILQEETTKGFLAADYAKLSSILHYILLVENIKPILQFPAQINTGYNADIYCESRDEASLWRHIGKISQKNGTFASIPEIIDNACNKRFTKARIRRAISRRLLNLGPEGPELPAYIRVLGFRKKDSDLLTKIDKHSQLPLITNLKHANSKLAANPLASKMFQEDLFAQQLFNQISGEAVNEFSRALVIV